MDTITFTRLQRYIIQQLGDETYSQNLPRLVSLVMSYVEKVSPSLQLNGDEKHVLCIEWIKRLVPSITQQQEQLLSEMIEVLCIATKGLLHINKHSSTTPSTSSSSTPVPLKASGSVFKKKTKTCFDGDTSSLNL